MVMEVMLKSRRGVKMLLQIVLAMMLVLLMFDQL